MSKPQLEGLFIGLMSGTSIDAIDAVLVSISDKIEIIDSHTNPIQQTLKNTILSLCASGDDEIHRSCELDRELGRHFAQCALALCKKTSINPNQISAIGSHGQTIRHSPAGKDAYSLQIGDPNTIAEQTSITTVADFRRRDIAAGGEGAPLVPAFHKEVFGCEGKNRAIINIGGMSNITLLPGTNGCVIGFDTGPGNILLDYWIHHCKSQQYDKDGDWAASGNLNSELLAQLLKEPYLQLSPPKSTGRELFNPPWFLRHLEHYRHINEADIQHTITEFTAQTIADSIKDCERNLSTTNIDELYICGGGAYNLHLMKRLKTLMAEKPINTTMQLGIAPSLVEATAFAWLAYRTLNHLNGSLASVTGASGDRVLGGIYLG